MKVLQLGKFYPIRGGVEKVMGDLTEGLGRAGVQCDMLCAAKGEWAGKTLTVNENARIICVPAFAKVAATMLSPEMVIYLRRHCREYDVIHVHHPDPMAALALWHSGYKGKVIVHWHSDILKQKTILKFYKPLQNWMLRRADMIVGTSPVYVRESPFLAGFQDKVTYLPIGVDRVCVPDEAAVLLRSRWPGKKLVFSLGRLVEYKGYEYLIRAAALLPDEYQVVIGGEGPMRPDLEALRSELGLDEKVIMPGRISEEDLPSWFGACDVFVLSSTMKTEAFAIVQVEAMSCGKPVVATKIPHSGVPWVNDDGVSGLNVPICDSRALADAIVAVCGDGDKYAHFCESAYTRYETMFTRDRMIAGCLDIYNSLWKR